VNNATSPSLTNDIFSQNSCGATSRIVKNNRDVQILQWNGVASEDSSANTLSATIELSRLLQEGDNCDQSIFLAQSKSVIVGVYTGPAIQRASAVKILQKFAKFAGSASVKPPQLAAQVCGSGNDATQTLGIFADATGNLSAVLSALQIWNRAQCLRDGDDLQLWENTPINVLGSDATFKAANATMASVSKRKHRARDTCSYTQAIANDGCWSLAQRCGITQAELEQYNPASDFCNDITVGEYVCCSAGSLPDFSPQPNSDGSCAEYSIQTNDTCIAIATAHSMTTTQLESRNSDVWGWSGCQYLYIGQVLCLSTGTLPMPAPIANAVCGPQVPNTTAPADMSDLAGLNPCPLNACCDIWGQCGITSDFCTNDPADTGAPGTAQPGSNGCISNCGTEIVSDGSSPSGFIRVGFYEAWNFQRPCLHMSVSYTHYPIMNYGGKEAESKIVAGGQY
jgi:chitinase